MRTNVEHFVYDVKVAPMSGPLHDRARAMRKAPTPAERRLWQRLRNRQLAGLKFRRQVPLGPYIADFACKGPAVIIECDGGQHAENSYDANRDAWFAEEGYRVFRFWNGEILDNLEGVLETILRTLGRP